VDIIINTAAVLDAADQIEKTNRKISNDVSEMDSIIRTLQQNWNSTASDSCANKYEYIKRSFFDSRFFVVDGLVLFMKKQVGEGYEMTEQAVLSATSAFK
jgi:hypothetical protein